MSIRIRVLVAVAYFISLFIAILVYAAIKVQFVMTAIGWPQQEAAAEVDLMVIADALTEAQMVFAILGVVSILSVSYFINLMRHHLLAPFDKLQRFTDEIARGRSDLRYTSEGSSEIDRLGARINDLLDMPEFQDANRKQQLVFMRRVLLGLFQTVKAPAALLDSEGDLLLARDLSMSPALKEAVLSLSETTTIDCDERHWQVQVLRPDADEFVGFLVQELPSGC